MTGGKRLRIAALFAIVLVFAFIMDMSSNAITDNTLIRNDTGDGDAVYDLVLNADGLDEDYSYQLKVREEQPSDKQANELFTQAKKEIDDTFCEENQSVEQVRGHVIMKDEYASGAVEAECGCLFLGQANQIHKADDLVFIDRHDYGVRTRIGTIRHEGFLTGQGTNKAATLRTRHKNSSFYRGDRTDRYLSLLIILTMLTYVKLIPLR